MPDAEPTPPTQPGGAPPSTGGAPPAAGPPAAPVGGPAAADPPPAGRGGGGAGAGGTTKNDTVIQTTRSWTGLYAVIIGDLAILGIALAGVIVVGSSNTTSTSVVAILTSAFTAIGTLTTAHFGIKAAANTAQTSLSQSGPPPQANGAAAS